MIFIYILIFIVGTLVGSFLNVVIFRLKVTDKGSKLNLSGRSKCPKCEKEIEARDLVPILSFLLLKGECRDCGAKIRTQYPIVELVSGLLPVIFIWHFGYESTYPYFLLLTSYFLLIIFFYDLNNKIIPDSVLLPLAIIGILYTLFTNLTSSGNLLYYVYGILIGGGFFLLLVLVSREKWMGFGDVKLGAVLGLLVSFPGIIVVLFSAFILGSIASLYLLQTGKRNLKSQVPFAPFLIIGYLIAVFAGNIAIDWYLGLI